MAEEEQREQRSQKQGGAQAQPQKREGARVQEHAQESESGQPDPPRKRWGLRIALGLAIVLVAALLVLAGFFAGSRWIRFNDAHDLQGTWYVAGTDVPVSITESDIVLNSSTSYAYELDTTAKTLTYRLGNLEGQGRYWFSDDRQTLIVTDGKYSMWDTLLADAGHAVARLFGGDELPVRDGSIVFGKAITLPGAQAPDAATASDAVGGGEVPSAEDGAREESAQDADGQASDSADGQQEAHGGAKDFDDLSISDALVQEPGGETEGAESSALANASESSAASVARPASTDQASLASGDDSTSAVYAESKGQSSSASEV